MELIWKYKENIRFFLKKYFNCLNTCSIISKNTLLETICVWLWSANGRETIIRKKTKTKGRRCSPLITTRLNACYTSNTYCAFSTRILLKFVTRNAFTNDNFIDLHLLLIEDENVFYCKYYTKKYYFWPAI